jgi:acyl CoA:acetate/3-ketoacid CoA transferase alpha subunit
MPDPDGFREYVYTHKPKGLVSKVMSEHDAVTKFVSNGDYITFDCEMLHRGPSSVLRELLRQGRTELWLGSKFNYVEINLFVVAGCVSRADVGMMGVLGPAVTRAVNDGTLKLTEWSNGAITARLLAGVMGVPFIPIRYLGGTDIFKYSGAKLVNDPYTGEKTILVPALNPDVGIVHVHECDIYGNSRVFGASTSPRETAMASRKVIISTERIVGEDEIRRDPGRTTIPYFMVDAVVEAPFGAYPANVPGRYACDFDHIQEMLVAIASDKMEDYLEKYIYSVSNHEEFLEKRVGLRKLIELQQLETIKEGYGQ